nr:hypothetical protein [Stenotrophomonas pavanii]
MTTNIELAQQVASRVEIESVSIRQCSFRANFEIGHLPAELALSQKYSASCDASRLAEDGAVIVTVSFAFTANEPSVDDSIGEEAMQIEADFALVYRVRAEDEIPRHCLAHFADVNGPYNAWPYWRELVSSCTGRVGLNSITVPVFRPRKFDVENVEC